MDQLASFRLNQLRCITEKDAKGGSEPYLWVTYFNVDAGSLGRPEPVTTYTPQFNLFRQEFPDNVADGQVMSIPPTLAKHDIIIDPDTVFSMAGCLAVLLEEDESPETAMEAGRRAYADEIHRQLNALVKKRIETLDTGAVTDAEIKTVKDAVKSKVKSAVKSKLSLGQKLFGNQDDFLSFSHVAFVGVGELVDKNFDFPELFEGGVAEKSSNRFVLSGSLAMGPVPPPPPPDPCANQRNALQKKKDEIKGFQLIRQSLQAQLQHATPQQKPAIIQQIKATGEKITQLEAELPTLEAALKACENKLQTSTHAEPSGDVILRG